MSCRAAPRPADSSSDGVRRKLRSTAATAALALCSVPAVGQEVTPHITYRAPAGCPDAEAFAQSVRERARGPAGKPRDLRPPEMTVVVSAVGPDFQARVEVTLASGEISSRQVVAPTCEQAAAAAAIIAAVALDRWEEGVNAAQHPSEPTEPVVAPVVQPPEKPSVAMKPRQFPGPVAEGGIGVEAEVGYVAESGAGPALMHGVAVSGGIIWEKTRWSGLFGAVYGDTGEATAGAGRARFQLLSGRLGGCVAGLRTATFRAQLCVATEAGRVRAEGLASEQFVRPGTAATFWWAGGPLGRLQLDLGRTVFLDGHGGPWFPLVRHSFVFTQPDATAHSFPVVGWTAAIGIGAKLP